MVTVLTPRRDEVRRIAYMPDAVVRNLLITQTYHELSAALRQRFAAGANWCTFATWASRQAGCTIRREDMDRALRARLGASADVERLARLAAGYAGGALQRAGAGVVLDAVMRALDADGALARASEAVASGNLKVFAEIGEAFAIFLESADTERFILALRDGDPPDGQRLLRDAFRAYVEAAHAEPGRAAQLMHFANLLVGLHEQTRLQPEILRALNAAFDGDAVRERIIAALLPGRWRAVRRSIAGLFGRRPPLDEALDAMLGLVQRELRALITSQAMTLDIAGTTIRLGRDLRATHAPSLSILTEPRLKELLARIDRDPYSAAGGGARDWGVLEQRMQLIADLFRCAHEWPHLFDAPFTAAQVAAMREGRVPAGRL